MFENKNLFAPCSRAPIIVRGCVPALYYSRYTRTVLRIEKHLLRRAECCRVIIIVICTRSSAQTVYNQQGRATGRPAGHVRFSSDPFAFLDLNSDFKNEKRLGSTNYCFFFFLENVYNTFT